MRRTTPFGLAVLASTLSLALAPTITHPPALAAGLALVALTLASPAVLRRPGLPGWADVLPPFLLFGAVALLRHAQGGASSAFSPMALLPIFWVALYGRRRAMHAAVAATALLFLGPLLLIGDPLYPDNEWRRAVLWIVNAALVGPAVQLLVRDVRQRTADLQLVSRLMRGLSQDVDVRRADVCVATRQATEADVVQLYELTAPDRLIRTAWDGDGADDQASVDLPHEATSTAVLLDHPRFVAGTWVEDTRHHLTPALVPGRDLRTVLLQPLRSPGGVLGVLVIGYRQVHQELPARVRELTAVLAAEVAVTLERRDLVRRLTEEVRTDPLTGASNRRHLGEELGREFAHAVRSPHPLAVLALDLDHFKRFNDAFGHGAGDRLLVEFVAAVRAQLRPVDMVARSGGEEFIVVLPGVELGEALDIGSRLLASVPSGQTCSIGVAQWDGTETDGQLLARADQALYAAKAAGRNRVVTEDRAPARPPVALPAPRSAVSAGSCASGCGRPGYRPPGTQDGERFSAKARIPS